MRNATVAAALAGFLLLLSGCGRPMLTGSGVTLRSIDLTTVYSPGVVSSGYTADDQATAHLYVSDIPLAELAGADSIDGLHGSITHLYMFLRPRPGKTPIETTASTVTIRQVVFANGEVGLYGGGGFLFPSGVPGDRSFGGSVRKGSVRLLASTPGFVDRLGAAEVSIGVVAPEDRASASILAHLLDHGARVASGSASADSR